MMSSHLRPPAAVFDECHRPLRSRLQNRILGIDTAVDHLLLALYSGGHVLLEGPPGTGKTTLAKTISDTLKGSTAGRVQFTPDLLPMDVTGSRIYDPRTQAFQGRPGPVDSNFLLVDEINRAPEKVQSSLLEPMAEGSFTIAGESVPRRIGRPFHVVATRNPEDGKGVFHISNALLDRFIMVVNVPAIHDALVISKILSRHADAQSLALQEGASADLGAINAEPSVGDQIDIQLFLDLQDAVAGIGVPENTLETSGRAFSRLANSDTHVGGDKSLERLFSPRGMVYALRVAKVITLRKAASSGFEGTPLVEVDNVRLAAIHVFGTKARLFGTDRATVEGAIDSAFRSV